MLKIFQAVKTLFLNLFFPTNCLGCGRDDEWFCSPCQKKIILNYHQTCPVCFKQSPQGKVCSSKCAREFVLDNLLVTTSRKANPVLDKVVHVYKYKLIPVLADYLSSLLLRVFLSEAENYQHYILVPVPLHPKREKWRGFNQAQELASRIGDKLKLPVLPLLKRIKNTQTQTFFQKEKRGENVKNAFQLNVKILQQLPPAALDQACFLLIDDVATTCSTLNECAKVLKENSIKKVGGLVVMRG